MSDNVKVVFVFFSIFEFDLLEITRLFREYKDEQEKGLLSSNIQLGKSLNTTMKMGGILTAPTFNKNGLFNFVSVLNKVTEELYLE